MTALRIAAIIGASIVTVGGSAAVATRDKWWPGENKETIEAEGDNRDSQVQTRNDGAGEDQTRQVASNAKPGGVGVP